MEYIFEGKFLNEAEKKYITIPFNVWEICEDNVGRIPVHVTINNNMTFDCNLSPLKNGYYNIPLTDEQSEGLAESTYYPVVFSVNGKESCELKSSPYSYENPIRKIDSMNIIIQPWDGLCGQTCFAMIAGITIEEASNVMHCREWQANMAKIVSSLDYVENLGRFSHYLVGYDGKYYDPNNGIMPQIDKTNIKGYLEIICE